MFGIPSRYIAIAAALLFGLSIWKAYSVGYEYANVKCGLTISEMKLKIEQEHSAEVKRLIAANQLAKEQQKELVDLIIAKETEIDRIIAENEEASRNDPDAGKCGISANGVSRINRVR